MDHRAVLESLADALLRVAKDGVVNNRFQPNRFPVARRTVVSVTTGDLMCDFFYSQDVTKPSRSNG
jgi:hypothetical protein